jgi:hypothetical protein
LPFRIGRGEIADFTWRNGSRNCQHDFVFVRLFGIRDDMFLGEGNKYYASGWRCPRRRVCQRGFARAPRIVNLQCDMDHPTQSLADLLHLVNLYGSFDALREKKL